jgi:hypothetical protein
MAGALRGLLRGRRNTGIGGRFQFQLSVRAEPHDIRPQILDGLEGIVAVECMVYAGVATRTGRKQSAERSLRQPDNASGCGEYQHDDSLQPTTGA